RLISDGAWADFQAKQERLKSLMIVLERTKLTAAMLGNFTSSYSEKRSDEESAVAGSAPASAHEWDSTVGQTCAQVLKRLLRSPASHRPPLMNGTPPSARPALKC